jgi:pyrophosphatase PpaX
MTPILSRHVLFDLDGTLVDTRASVVECYKRVFRNLLDRPFPPDTIDTGLLFAMRPREVFFLVAPDRVEELYQAYHETYPRCTDKIKVFDGVKDLINALGASGRKPSLVTNKGLDRTLVDLSVADIAPDAFTVIVTAEDTADRKPHPAPILLGLERAGATPAESVYVGDGPQDIIAARAAHLPCIAVS